MDPAIQQFQTRDSVPLRPGMVIYQCPVIFDDDGGVRVKWIEPHQIVVDDFEFDPANACFLTPKQGVGRAYLSDCYSTKQGAITAAIEKFQFSLRWEIKCEEDRIDWMRRWLDESSEPGWFERILGDGG